MIRFFALFSALGLVPAPASASGRAARPSPAQLALVPRVALHVHSAYIEPVLPGRLMLGAAEGIVREAGLPAAAATPELSRFAALVPEPARAEDLPAFLQGSVRGLSALWDAVPALSSPQAFTRAGLRGLVGSLDAHSEFYAPEAYARLRTAFDGSKGKLGLGFSDAPLGPRVVTAVASGSPAEAAGVRPGDEVLAVDGAPAAGLGLEEFRALLRRPEVRLEVRRTGAGGESRLEVPLRRADFRARVLSPRLDPDGTGVLRIAMFQSDAAADIQAALIALAGAGARRLVLDLRGNPGGEETTVLQAASLFLLKGQAIATFRDREGAETHEVAVEGEFARTPLRVLVDGATASAAEILAAAIRENGRGLLAGSRTFGKGSVQRFFELEDGSAYKLTVRRWFTPSGRHLDRERDGGGLEPDLPLEDGSSIW